ncbi:MAG TPA: cellulase family glycosylhydrolase [Planctomycetota bacterium]|nr:cellulase family glycosylhydrolase [Planctomycetota bacterium]
MPTTSRPLFSLAFAILALLAFASCEHQENSTEREAPVTTVTTTSATPAKTPASATASGDTKGGDTDKGDDAVKEKPKSDLPVAEHGYLIDGFEGPEHTVWAFDSADDEGTAQYVEEGATQGKKALKITLRGKGKTGKFNVRRDVSMDLSHAAALLIDFTAPSDKFSLALSITCGPHDILQESKSYDLKKGLNKSFRIPLTGNTWKNEKSKWEYTAPPVNLQFVQRICLLIFTNGESSGSVLIDNLRAEPDETPFMPSGSLVHREWRPELLGVSGIPTTIAQYQGIDAHVFFRASYRDFFDANDIAAGMRVYSPSGKALDVRAFFEDWMAAPKDVLAENEGEANPPLWGPIDTPQRQGAGGARRGGGRGRGNRAANATDSASKDGAVPDAEKKEPPKQEETDPAKIAEVKKREEEQKKKLEQIAKLRVQSTRLLPVWGIRFTPLETGQYTLQIYVRNNAGEVRTEERKLIVLPERKNTALPGRLGGNVRVSKRDPRQFELSNGDPFFVFGQNVCWTRDWRPYLDKMHDYGANAVRVWLCPWGLNLERKSDPGSYDLDVAEQIDELFNYAETKGVRIIFCFTFHGMTQGNWGDSPYNSMNGGPCGRPDEFFTNYRAKGQFKRLLSYSAARWGSSPALLSWELMNEIDLAKFTYIEEPIAWAREMAGHLKGVDAHGHLVTVSATMKNTPLDLWTDSRLDWVQIHAYGTDVSNLFFERISPFQNLAKPVLMGEFGGGTESRDDIPDQDGARLQASLWLSACSPSCGVAMPWWWDTYIESRNLYPVLAAAKKFIAGEDRRGRYGQWVRKMYPDNVEVAGIMDAQGGRFYVHKPDWTVDPNNRRGALLNRAMPIELTGMNDGNYTIEFWDAKDGTKFQTQPASAREGKLPITLSAHAGEYGIKVDRAERTGLGLK